MARKEYSWFEEIVGQRRRKRIVRRVAAVLSVVVLFTTVNSLKHKADTLERIPTCGYADHVHSDDCFDGFDSLVCDRHVHTDACYQTRPASKNGGASLDITVDAADAVLPELDDAALEIDLCDALDAGIILDAFAPAAIDVPDALDLGEGIELPEEPLAEPTTEPKIEKTAEPQAEATAAPTAQPVVELPDEIEIAENTKSTAEPVVEEIVESTEEPRAEATVEPTAEPETEATVELTSEPEVEATVEPTAEPVVEETVEATIEPEVEATVEPTAEPEVVVTVEPTEEPEAVASVEPTAEPMVEKTVESTAEPVVEETVEATIEPEVEETIVPTSEPVIEETIEPTAAPEIENIIEPSEESDAEPTAVLEAEETVKPTEESDAEPTVAPETEETVKPTEESDAEPTAAPEAEEITKPSVESDAEPTAAPEAEEITEPTEEPDTEPTAAPVSEETAETEEEASTESTAAPEAEETAEPTDAPAAESTPAPEAEETDEPTDAQDAESTPNPEEEETAEPAEETAAEPTAAPEADETTEPEAGETAAPEAGETVAPTAESTDAPDDDVEVAETAAPDDAETDVEAEEDADDPELADDAEADAEDADAEAEELEEGEALPALIGTQYVSVDGANYSLVIGVPEAANLPEDAVFAAKAIRDNYYSDAALDAVEADGRLDVLALFDLTIYDGEGNVIQPEAALEIGVDFGGDLAPDTETFAVHFPGTGEQGDDPEPQSAAPETLEAMNSDGVVGFEADSFSYYAIVGSRLEGGILASDGQNYRVSVDYGPEAGIPEGAVLDVKEIEPDSEAYAAYRAMAEDALDWNAGTTGYARFFDITILHDGVEIQPKRPVDVTIKLADAEEDDLRVVHFGDRPEAVEAQASEGEVSFEARGFSVYGVAYQVKFNLAGSNYQFSMPGGGFCSLSQLLDEVVGTGWGPAALPYIATVESSNPDNLWIGKVDAQTTVGALKQANGIVDEYDNGLTVAQINEINNRLVAAGDWALISRKPFETTQTVKVKLTNQAVFTINVSCEPEKTTSRDDAEFFLYLERGEPAPETDTRQHAASFYTPHFRMTGKVDGEFISGQGGYTTDVSRAVGSTPSESAWKAVAKQNFRLSDEDLEHIEVVWYAASDNRSYRNKDNNIPNEIENHCSGYHVDGYLRWKNDGYAGSHTIQHYTTITGSIWWFKCEQPETCTVVLLHKEDDGTLKEIDRKTYGANNGLYDFVWTGLEDEHYKNYVMRIVGLSPAIWDVEYTPGFGENGLVWRTNPDYSEAFFYQDGNYPNYGYKLLASATKKDDVQWGNIRITKATTTDGDDKLDITPPNTQFTITGPDGYTHTVLYRDFLTDEDGHKYLQVEDLPLGTYTVTESGANVDKFTLTTTTPGEVKLETKDQTVDADFQNTYETKGYYIQKRFTLNNASIANWIRDYGADTNAVVYFKLWDDNNKCYVNELGQHDPGKVFTLHYGDVKKSPGNYAEGGITYIEYGDELRYTLYLPDLPTGNYVPRECDSKGNNVIENGDAAYYLQCSEMDGKLLIMKNVVTSFTAAKHWDDKGNAVATHPDVTFILQKKLGNDGKWVEADRKTLSESGDRSNYHAPGLSSDGSYIPYPYVEWNNLPRWDVEQGKQIFYRTVEFDPKAISGYAPQDTVAEDGNVYGDDDWQHVTYTNALETVQVTVQKKWEPVTPPTGAKVTLTLKSSDGKISVPIILNGKSDWPEETKGENWGDDWEHYSQTPTNAENAHEGNNWTAIWSNLPKFDGQGEVIAYTVTETEGWSGYRAVYATTDNTTATSVVLTGDGKDHWNGALTNRQKVTADIRVVKIDQTTRGTDREKRLSGAEFRLLVKQVGGTEGDGEYVVYTGGTATGTTDENGTLVFEDLVDGEYRIEETKAPDGYVRLEQVQADFTVSGGVVTAMEETNLVTYALATGGQLATYTVGNTPGARLPSTGGTGTLPCYIIGSLLLFIAAALLAKRRIDER